MPSDELGDIESEIRNTQVVILAGGKAKRMNCPDVPKAMTELNGKPLIDYCIKHYKNCGFTELKLLLGYLHEKIENHVGDGSRYGAHVKYSVEPETCVGRGMALKLALDNGTIDRTKRSIVCFPDDLIIDSKFPIRLLLQHVYGIEKFGSMATVVFVSGTTYPYGVADLDDSGLIQQFEEKPFIQKITSTGVYVIEPKIYDIIDEKLKKNDASVDRDHLMERNVFPELAAKKGVFSLVMPPGCWVSINTQKEYELAEKMFKNRACE